MSEVYDRYVDTAGNYYCTNTETGHHMIRKNCGKQRMKFLCDSCEKYPCDDSAIKLMKYCPIYSPKPKPQTNADRIRSMTDEEIAEWYWWMLRYVQGYTDSRLALSEWLKEGER